MRLPLSKYLPIFSTALRIHIVNPVLKFPCSFFAAYSAVTRTLYTVTLSAGTGTSTVTGPATGP